jgi:plasmid stability protein
MTTLTVHDLPEAETQALRARAARNGRSLEAEVRAILCEAAAAEPSADEGGLATAIRRRFAPYGGVELPPRLDEGGLATEIRELFASIGGADIPEHPPVTPREPSKSD